MRNTIKDIVRREVSKVSEVGYKDLCKIQYLIYPTKPKCSQCFDCWSCLEVHNFMHRCLR